MDGIIPRHGVKILCVSNRAGMRNSYPDLSKSGGYWGRYSQVECSSFSVLKSWKLRISLHHSLILSDITIWFDINYIFQTSEKILEFLNSVQTWMRAFLSLALVRANGCDSKRLRWELIYPVSSAPVCRMVLIDCNTNNYFIRKELCNPDYLLFPSGCVLLSRNYSLSTTSIALNLGENSQFAEVWSSQADICQQVSWFLNFIYCVSLVELLS